MATNGVLKDLPSKQKAAQYDPKDNAAHVRDIPIPSIKPDELLVKVRSASLCHSDLMLFEPNEQGLILTNKPVTMGHEAVGKVLEVGRETKGFKWGDTVGFMPVGDCCFECKGCQVSNLFCELGTQKIQRFSADGYFQEYVAVKYRNAVILPEGMDPAKVAPLCCAGVTSFNAVSAVELQLGDWLAIIGCGGLGHLELKLIVTKEYSTLKRRATHVIGIDISPDALLEAKAQGAEHVFNPIKDKDYIQTIKQLTTKGCKAAINFTNSVAAYAAAPDVLRINGLLLVVGIPQQPLTFKALDLSMCKFRVKGANNGTQLTLQKCIDFSYKHDIKPHMDVYSLDRFEEMINVIKKGEQRGRLGVVFD